MEEGSYSTSFLLDHVLEERDGRKQKAISVLVHDSVVPPNSLTSLRMLWRCRPFVGRH